MNKRLLLKLFALAGLINGIWMLILHIRYDKLGGVCAVNEKISCEVLTYKQYSEWFGIPTPLYAAFTFLILFILAYRGWKKIGERQIHEDVYTWLLSTIALLSAIAMAYISFVILKKLCIFCFLFYIIITAAWLLSTKILKSHGENLSTVIKHELSTCYKDPWLWFAGVAFACVFSFAHVAFEKTASLSNEKVEIHGDEIKTTGNPNAKVSLVIFSDFQCPACKHAASILREIEQSYASKIKITYKFFPLDPSCNPGAPYGQHLMACDAAKAALCAAEQGGFWRYHDHLFDSQTSLYEKKFYEFAEQENLNMENFSECYESNDTTKSVTKDAEEGAALKVNATPTIYLNGKKYEGILKTEDVKKMIDSLL